MHLQKRTLDCIIAFRLLIKDLVECYMDNHLDINSNYKTIKTTI